MLAGSVTATSSFRHALPKNSTILVVDEPGHVYDSMIRTASLLKITTLAK
jgi:hypothetical protein